MTTSNNTIFAEFWSKLFDFIDSITLNNLMQTNICDWNNIFSNKQLLSKYIQQDEIMNRIREFKSQYQFKAPKLYLHYVLNFDIENSTTTEINIELLLSYYIWRKTYPTNVFSSADDQDLGKNFTQRCNTKQSKYKEYMKINMNHAKHWSMGKFNEKCSSHKQQLAEYSNYFASYHDSKLTKYHPIYHHYKYRNYETIIMTANNPFEFRNPYDINIGLLVYGYIRSSDRELHDIIIPTEITDIVIKYFDTSHKKYFDRGPCVCIYESGNYSCQQPNENINHTMEDILFLPKIMTNNIQRWYCLRCNGLQTDGVFGADAYLVLKTYFFAQIKSNVTNKLRFIVTILDHRQYIDESSSEDSSSDGSSD